MELTLKNIEERAKQMSQQGIKMRLYDVQNGYEWQIQLDGVPGIFNSGSTTANSKPLAFIMALGMI